MTRAKKQSTEAAVREIRRRTRRKFAPEEKVRIVLEGLRGEQSISKPSRARQDNGTSRAIGASERHRPRLIERLDNKSLVYPH
jgi:hypothetical protein